MTVIEHWSGIAKTLFPLIKGFERPESHTKKMIKG